MAPFSSHLSIGTDPAPWFFPETGTRASAPSYRTRCWYQPRSRFTHLPKSPSNLLVAFRDEWERIGAEGNTDLGEFAEIALLSAPAPVGREARMYRRFLGLLATVLPRPMSEFECRFGIVRAAA